MQPCPACAGRGCEGCRMEGLVELTAADLPDQGTYQALLAAEMAAHGCWPVAGGWLDQTEICVQAVLAARRSGASN
ncbi:MAG: hypothetical protein KAY37_01040 [Phycisphaerae bacterium]|nr:hypothetical protein [Phycisphaerae bacterium]